MTYLDDELEIAVVAPLGRDELEDCLHPRVSHSSSGGGKQRRVGLD